MLATTPAFAVAPNKGKSLGLRRDWVCLCCRFSRFCLTLSRCSACFLCPIPLRILVQIVTPVDCGAVVEKELLAGQGRLNRAMGSSGSLISALPALQLPGRNRGRSPRIGRAYSMPIRGQSRIGLNRVASTTLVVESSRPSRNFRPADRRAPVHPARRDRWDGSASFSPIRASAFNKDGGLSRLEPLPPRSTRSGAVLAHGEFLFEGSPLGVGLGQ